MGFVTRYKKSKPKRSIMKPVHEKFASKVVPSIIGKIIPMVDRTARPIIEAKLKKQKKKINKEIIGTTGSLGSGGSL